MGNVVYGWLNICDVYFQQHIPKMYTSIILPHEAKSFHH